MKNTKTQQHKFKHITASFAQESNMKPMPKEMENHHEQKVDPMELAKRKMMMAGMTPDND